MPILNRTACKCGGTRTDGKCDRCHTSKGKHERTTTQRGYGADWQRVSRMVRELRPLCEVCQARGIVRAASEVHHKQPISIAPSLRLEMSNLMSVCRECHEWLERDGSDTGGRPFSGT